MGLLDFLKETIGVDPGSQNLRIIKDAELVFDEESQLSIDNVKGSVSGIGNSISKTVNDRIIRPVNYGIADFQGFEMLLRGAIKKALHPRSFFPKSYIVYYCIPTGSTEIDLRAYRDSAEHVGAVEVFMIYQSSCAAVGMNILFEVKHFILVDFSSSKIEIIVFADSVIISTGIARFGTWKIYQLLRNYIRRKHNVDLSDQEVEDLLLTLGRYKNQSEITIRYTSIAIQEIEDLVGNFLCLVNDELLEVIERVSDHAQIQKILVNGIYFTGGGSTIEFLRKKINHNSKIKHTMSENPSLDNINGLKKVMTNKEKFKDYLFF